MKKYVRKTLEFCIFHPVNINKMLRNHQPPTRNKTTVHLFKTQHIHSVCHHVTHAHYSQSLYEAQHSLNINRLLRQFITYPSAHRCYWFRL